MKRLKILIISVMLSPCLLGCRSAYHSSNAVSPDTEQWVTIKNPVGGGQHAISQPQAVIYRTNGDFVDNVPITLSPEGTLVSYPSPTDITESSRPISVADGFLLDRRGISKNSVFTRYTYAKYASLTSTPSVQQLLEAVIPDSHVTDIHVLPMTLSQAVADTAAVNSYIKSLSLK